MENYYNTNNESGQVLKKSVRKAKKQNDIILEYFSKNSNNKFSADQIHLACMNQQTPLTSTRRAITDLTNAGLLEMLDEMIIGIYGKQVHLWKYKSQIGQLKLL